MKTSSLSTLLLFLSLLSYGQTFTECFSEYDDKTKKVMLDVITKKMSRQKADSLINAIAAVYDGCVIGKELPEFDLISVSGKHYTNEDLRGKAVLINIWRITCGPCIGEIPVLNKIDSEYRDNKDFVFISLILEKPEKFDKFQENKGTVWKKGSLWDIDFELIVNPMLFGSLSVRGGFPYPTNLFVDKNGKIVKKTVGAPSDSIENETKLRSEIEELLSK